MNLDALYNKMTIGQVGYKLLRDPPNDITAQDRADTNTRYLRSLEAKRGRILQRGVRHFVV